MLYHLVSNLTRRRDEKTDFKQQPHFAPDTVHDQEELKEDSLTRLKASHAAGLQQYKVKDGEFAHYPEIQSKTVDKLIARGIKSLFPIQQHCFYPIYNREDVIARDLTGSGKTLGFALPIVELLRKNRCLGQRKIQAIVLAPTRELALQVSTFSLSDHSADHP
jgi:superfamily II DNA/RNA helicase